MNLCEHERFTNGFALLKSLIIKTGLLYELYTGQRMESTSALIDKN